MSSSSSKRRKNDGAFQPPPAMDETEFVAFCFVLLVTRMFPTLDKGEAYNIVYSWLLDGVDEESAVYYGDMLSNLVVYETDPMKNQH